MKYAVPVADLMSKEPIVVGPDATVAEVARVMKERDVGSIIIISDHRPMGIVTEKDLVTKVVARDAIPSKVRVGEIMSTPVVAIDPLTEVVDAARKMASLHIRRLPVVRGGELVGVVTEADILKIWPALIEVTRERARMASSPQGEEVEGYCEKCSMFAEDLMPVDGQLLCADCREEEQSL